jgi:hypothetical protein
MKDMYLEELISCPTRDSCDGLTVSSIDDECVCSCPGMEDMTRDTVTHAEFEALEAYTYLFTFLR